MNGKRARRIRQLRSEHTAAVEAKAPLRVRNAIKRRIAVAERGGPNWRRKAAA